MENTCIHPDPLQVKEIVKEKHVRLVLTKNWYVEVSAGRKCYEFRLVGKYWTPRLKDATHLIFAQGSWIAAGPWFLFSPNFSIGTECSICIHANLIIAPVDSVLPPDIWNSESEQSNRRNCEEQIPFNYIYIYIPSFIALENAQVVGDLFTLDKKDLAMLCWFMCEGCCPSSSRLWNWKLLGAPGYGKTWDIAPKRIISIEEVNPEKAMKLGAPSGQEFTDLFGDQGDPLYAIHFEQVLPEDLPKESPLQNDVCLMGPNLQEHRKLIYMHQGVYIYIFLL